MLQHWFGFRHSLHSSLLFVFYNCIFMACDRLSALPDNLLCSYILSNLSLRDATRCSVLSRRWRYLCTLLSHLTFSSQCFPHQGKPTERAINNILFFHSAQLQSFELSVSMGDMDIKHIGKCFQKWVHSACLKRVKQITLGNGMLLNVPNSLFSCNCLTYLKLHWFTLTKLPPYFSGFSCLVTCSLSHIYTNDDIIEQLVAQSHLLENITVHRCRGLNSLKISALNLKYLDLNGLDCPQLIMNCPQLVNFIVDDCPSMSSLEVSSCGFLDLSTTEVNVITGFSTTNMLRKVTLHGYRREVPDLHGINGPGEITLHFRAQVLSIEALGRFLNLEDLSIESDWFKTQAESVEVSSLTLPLKFLKKVHVKISTFDKEEIDLLGCLFRSTPSLQTMTLTLSRCSQYIHELSFLKRLLGLKRFSDSSVIIAEKYEGNCERCKEGE